MPDITKNIADMTDIVDIESQYLLTI